MNYNLASGSPDGSLFAWSRAGGDIAVVDVKSLKQTSLGVAAATRPTPGTTAAISTPSFSSGNQIAYSTYDGTNSKVILSDANGKQVRAFDLPGAVAWPQWSPRGDSLLYETLDPQKPQRSWTCSVALLDTNTGTTTNITRDVKCDPLLGEYSPRWSPDEQRLLVEKFTDGPAGVVNSKLLAVDRNGQETTVDGSHGFTPAWLGS
jgi:Tol biopolymer transport system component